MLRFVCFACRDALCDFGVRLVVAAMDENHEGCTPYTKNHCHSSQQGTKPYCSPDGSKDKDLAIVLA